MSVPILDEAYMRRRAQLLYMDTMMGSFRQSYERAQQGDTAESLREEYASGALTFEQFERRLERLLGCT